MESAASSAWFEAVSVKSYKISLPNGKEFTCITDELVENIPAAILERFLVLPVSVIPL